MTEIRVECVVGYRGESGPARFYLGETQVEIVEIVDRWLGPDHRYYKVRGENRDLYILRHDKQTQRWDLTLFSREEYLTTGPVSPHAAHSMQVAVSCAKSN